MSIVLEITPPAPAISDAAPGSANSSGILRLSCVKAWLIGVSGLTSRTKYFVEVIFSGLIMRSWTNVGKGISEYCSTMNAPSKYIWKNGSKIRLEEAGVHVRGYYTSTAAEIREPASDIEAFEQYRQVYLSCCRRSHG